MEVGGFDDDQDTPVVLNRPSIKQSLLDSTSVSALFDRSLHVLPVRLTDIEVLSVTEPTNVLYEGTPKRLIVVLLNEQDQRISDQVSIWVQSIETELYIRLCRWLIDHYLTFFYLLVRLFIYTHTQNLFIDH